MTTIVLVQHAEKEAHAGDPGLTALGRRQAQRAAHALAADGGLAAVVTSPLLRARQTAAAVAESMGAPVAVDHRLRERLNLDVGTDRASFLADWQRSSLERDWTPPGGRSSAVCGDEMRAALRDAVVAGRRVAVVSHGGATADLLRTLLGDDVLTRRAPTLLADGVPAAALTTLRPTSAGWEVVRIAAVDHLDDGERTAHAR